MSILEGASPDTPLRTAFEPRQVAFNKPAWQRQYMKQRLQDPKHREKYNEYQRAYQKNKWATDPEYRARRKAIKQKYLSKLKAQPEPLPN